MRELFLKHKAGQGMREEFECSLCDASFHAIERKIKVISDKEALPAKEQRVGQLFAQHAKEQHDGVRLRVPKQSELVTAPGYERAQFFVGKVYESTVDLRRVDGGPGINRFPFVQLCYPSDTPKYRASTN